MQKPLNPLVFCASLSTNTWGGSPLFLRGRGGTGVCRAEITSSRSGLDSSCVPPPSVLQTGGFSHSLRQEDINYHQQRERERETTLSVNPHEEQLHESRQKPHLSIKHTCTDTHHTLYLHNLHEPDVSPLWLCSSSPVQQRGLCNRCFTLPQPGLESQDKIWMFYLLLYGINLCICVNKERGIFKISAGLDHIIISNSLYLLFYASGLV